jgi:hypothetical protein
MEHGAWGIEHCGLRIADLKKGVRRQESGEKEQKRFFYLLDSGY